MANSLQRGIKNILTALNVIVSDADQSIEDFALAQPNILADTDYPAEVPNQTYERTLDLAVSWEVTQATPNSWDITNEAEHGFGKYAKWVVSKARQAAIHQGRWWFAEDIVQDGVVNLFEQIGQNNVKVWEAIG